MNIKKLVKNKSFIIKRKKNCRNRIRNQNVYILELVYKTS